ALSSRRPSRQRLSEGQRNPALARFRIPPQPPVRRGAGKATIVRLPDYANPELSHCVSQAQVLAENLARSALARMGPETRDQKNARALGVQRRSRRALPLAPASLLLSSR